MDLFGKNDLNCSHIISQLLFVQSSFEILQISLTLQPYVDSGVY